MGKQKTTEWHISDYIKTDEDVHALLAAEREPYEKALREALKLLRDIHFWLDEVLVPGDINAIDQQVIWLNLKLQAIHKYLKNEGITIEEEKCEISMTE